MINIMNFLFAILLSASITPLTIKLNILDKPNYRKIHEKPIPKGGGIGFFIPVLLLEMSTFCFFNSIITMDTTKYFTIMATTFSLLTLGMIDDKFELGSKVKLFIQTVVTILTLSTGLRFQPFGIEVLDLLLTAVWIIGIMNAVNLIDGLDGLAAGVAAISCVGFSVIGLVFGNAIINVLSLIIMGGCIGFLKYNFNPARVFMGDAGSVPLGYNLAIIGILCENTVRGKTALIIPVIIAGIPIYDTLLTIIRRAINHKPIFQPDRSHFYNLMMDIKGIGHKNTVLIIYSISVLLITLSCILALLGPLWRIAGICSIIAAALILTKRLGFIKIDRT